MNDECTPMQNYVGAQLTCDVQPDILQKLAAQKSSLERQLREVNEALEALTSNPELERVFRLVSKVSHRL